MRKNNKLIIIISIILVLALLGAVFVYLYLMTDMFKSNRELFAKYFAQELQTLEKITDLKTAEVYKNLKYQDIYESNTHIKIIDSEGGEVSAPLNNLSATLDIQKKAEEQYIYAIGQVLYEDEAYLNAEVIKDGAKYGIRFKDAAKQFVTIEKDEKLEAIANDIGIEATQLDEIINTIDGSQETTYEQKLYELKDKYLNIITRTISGGTFEKQKNAMITYNNVTTKTNAYSVSLSGEQVQNTLIEILNNAQTDFDVADEEIEKINEKIEIPTAKITVYEQKQNVIRTVIEVGLYKVEIENVGQEGNAITNIEYLDLNDEQEKRYIAKINKKNAENNETFEIVVDATEGDNNYTVSVLSQMNTSNERIELNLAISHEQDITTKSIVLENEVDMVGEFEKTQTLTSGNYILLNSGEEQRRKQMVDLVKKLVTESVNGKIDLLKEKLGLKNEDTENLEPEEEISQVEINKFNAKFEFYTGDEVSAENVKMLLDIVKSNLASYEDMNVENQENTESVIPSENKLSIKLNIQKDTTNEDFEKILEKIDKNKKYKVFINYKTSNGLIDYITISEI